MFKKLLSKIGIGSGGDEPPPPTTRGYAPYGNPAINHLYNLLFCDDLELFRTPEAINAGGPWTVLFATPPDEAALRALAADEEAESRVRILALNRLRAAGYPVEPKLVLGVIVEVRLQQGLDVIAAYADGRVRYLNQTGRASIFDGAPPPVAALGKELVTTAQPLASRIGPWDKSRLPPPGGGNVRISFLVSDGLYFGEGPFETLERDELGAPIIRKAGQLLQLAVDTAIKGSQQS